ELGGRAAGAGAAHGQLRDRSAHRRSAGRLRSGRVDHSWVHRVPRARCPARTGRRSHLLRRLPLHAVLVAVRDPRLQPVAPARDRHGTDLSVAPALPAAPPVRTHGRAVVAQVTRAPWSLPALLAEYPDAVVIQTHRDPLRVIASI